jgi:hypothetical protein
MNSSIDRTAPTLVLRDVKLEMCIALKSFLKHWHKNQWMKSQEGWLADACLLASCDDEEDSFARRILYCSRYGYLCCWPDFCHRCALDQRIEPVQCEYGNSFSRGPYWYAAVLNTECSADRAGLWKGDGTLDRNEAQPLFLPHAGRSNGFAVEADQVLCFRDICEGLFAFVKHLIQKNVIAGALASLEIDVSFWPGADGLYDFWSGIQHALLPHVNLLFNTRAPMTDEAALLFYRIFSSVLGQYSRLSYPNAWFAPVLSQDALDTWLGYILKPWPVHKWYHRARSARCDPWHLNLLFDEIVYESAVYLASRVRSPRKFGNLNPGSFACPRPEYIGTPVPPVLNKKQMALLTDEIYWDAHDELHASFFRTVDKRRLRRGNRGHEPEIEY